MSTGAQVDLDWAGVDAAPDAAQAASKPSPSAVTEAKDLTDEEILGIEAITPEESGTGFSLSSVPAGRQGPSPRTETPEGNSRSAPRLDDHAQPAGTENRQAEACPTGAMPPWMAAAAADPRHSGEAQELWREHQEFRAAFASPDEARAVKELLPGGVRDVLSLRQATQSVERIDAALFSGDARAQAEVVAEIARANPAAFRSLFAEAAKVLAGLRGTEAGGREARNSDASALSELEAGNGDGRARGDDDRGEHRRHSGEAHQPGPPPPPSQGANDPPPGDPPDMAGGSVGSPSSSGFDPAAYAAFERSTNDVVARDVRGSINDTLSRVMPEGVAEGAARRIGEDIFHEVHRALAADRTLSDQVAAVLHERRFGPAEQQRVSALLAGRARQLVPSVARRVIGEWTSSVLSTARSKAARQAAAASRVDIAGQGGSLDSMPLRSAGTGSREVNYASMSDEEILGM